MHPTPAGGDLQLGYYDNDAAASITQGETTIGYSLDAALRRKTQTTTDNTGRTTLTRHYTDNTDNPTWTIDVTNNVTTTTRYAELISGDLSLTITTTNSGGPVASLAVAGTRGDVTTSIRLPDNATNPTTGPPATGIETWNDYDEYGNPHQPDTTTDPGTTQAGTTQGIGYGWLGTKQRATTTLGLTLMGARLYNPATGLLTTIDPEYQGGDTTYSYPNDPINNQDVDGRWWNKIKQKAAEAKACASLGVKGCGLAAWAAVVALQASKRAPGNLRNAVRHFIWQSLLFMAVGRAGATRVGLAHEVGSTNPEDTRKDLLNNRRTLALYSGRGGSMLRAPGNISRVYMVAFAYGPLLKRGIQLARSRYLV